MSFSPSSYRTPRRPISPNRFTIWNTPSPRSGFKTPAANQFLSTGKRRRNTTSIIRRSPALNGFARTGGVFGRFQPSGVESKFLDINANSAGLPAGASWGLTSINPVPIGDGPSGRIGRQITVTSIQAMYQLDVHHTESNTVYMRLMFVLDKQCNGAAPVIGDIYDTSALTNISYCTRNRNNMKRFQILKEGVFEPNITRDSVYSTGTSTMYNWYTGIPEKQAWYSKFETPFYYKGNAGTVADMASNALFFVYHADSFFNTTASYPIANSALQGQVCMCYTDE